MGFRWGLIAVSATAAAGVGTLTGCVTNLDVPDTFAATVTITGEANQVSADSGAWFGAAHLAPGHVVSISAGTAVTTAFAPLRFESSELNSDGTGKCTYTAHFESIAANQRSYGMWVSNYVRQQSFTADQLKSGATYHLQAPGY